MQFIYHSNRNISNFKIYNFEHIFCMFFFSGKAKYVHEPTTSALPLLHTNHNRSLPAEQGLTPHSHHTRNKCTFIIPYLMPLEVLKYQTQIIILPCMYFWLFPWQPTLCSILPLFLYLGGSTGSGYRQDGETISGSSCCFLHTFSGASHISQLFMRTSYVLEKTERFYIYEDYFMAHLMLKKYSE